VIKIIISRMATIRKRRTVKKQKCNKVNRSQKGGWGRAASRLFRRSGRSGRSGSKSGEAKFADYLENREKINYHEHVRQKLASRKDPHKILEELNNRLRQLYPKDYTLFRRSLGLDNLLSIRKRGRGTRGMSYNTKMNIMQKINTAQANVELQRIQTRRKIDSLLAAKGIVEAHIANRQKPNNSGYIEVNPD